MPPSASSGPRPLASIPSPLTLAPSLRPSGAPFCLRTAAPSPPTLAPSLSPSGAPFCRGNPICMLGSIFPYASSGGIRLLREPPTASPVTAVSNPLMTCYRGSVWKWWVVSVAVTGFPHPPSRPPLPAPCPTLPSFPLLSLLTQPLLSCQTLASPPLMSPLPHNLPVHAPLPLR